MVDFDNDKVVFIPSAELERLFANLRAEFTVQLDLILSEIFRRDIGAPATSREDFVRMFNAHVHRYQQLFLYLRDYDLLQNILLDTRFMTVQVKKGDDRDAIVPVIRMHDEHLLVGYEPLDLGLDRMVKDCDILSVASVPLLDHDAVPYGGRANLVTSTHDNTEVVLIYHRKETQRLVLMWGDSIVEAHGGFSPPSPSLLN